MDQFTHLFTGGPSAVWSSFLDKPLSTLVPLITIAGLPLALFTLYRTYAISPVLLIHNKKPVKITTYDPTTETTQSEDMVEYIKKRCPSLYGPNAVYKPTFWLANGHLQTACSAVKGFEDVYQIDYHR
ncbi:hypothetical protein BGZ95_004212, partial [Linnemannia exigua]